MLHHTDPASGLTLTLESDPEPRNPRLADDPLFHFVTWTRGLGDPHGWATRLDLITAMREASALILPLRAVRSNGKPTSLVRIIGADERPAGYAVVTHERLRLHYETEEITPDIVEAATTACDVELLDYEEFLHGDVHAFTVATVDGQVLERRPGLLGSQWAEAVAWRAFDHHLANWRDDELSRRAV